MAIRSRLQFPIRPIEDTRFSDHLIVLTGAGGETLEPIGKAHIANYEKFMGLNAGAKFLEIGCGNGRDALQLLDLLGSNGQYIGIDVTRDSIVWCQKNITSAYPNFEFYHFDAEHELYNPLGTKMSMDFKLPVADGSIVSNCIGFSIYAFVRGGNRSLHERNSTRTKPDGRAYATFFLYSDETVAASRRNDLTSFNRRFEHTYGNGCFVNDSKLPDGSRGIHRRGERVG